MLHIQRLTFAVILTSATLSACATDQGQALVDDNKPVPQIQSAKDLDIYLRTTPNSPIDHLSAVAKQRFVDSLVFTENGLGSFGYSELETLSPTEIHQILTLFGTEHTTSMITKSRVSNDSDKAVMRLKPLGDHDGYYCESKGTCAERISSICTSNC